jgi:hypothetical protein
MAYAVQLTFTNTTIKNYDKSVKRLGAFPGGPHPDPGCLFHWVEEISGGFIVIDVWKNKEYFETFRTNILGPVAAELHTPEPVPREIKVHNYLTAGC